jgi:hypothetical protein
MFRELNLFLTSGEGKDALSGLLGPLETPNLNH